MLNKFKLGKKKKTYGMEPKQRTRKEVDAEYTNHAILLGHKTRQLAQINQDAGRCQKEIDDHLSKLLQLNEEGMKLPPEEAPSTETVEQKEGA